MLSILDVKDPIPVVPTREALLRRPNGVSLLQVFLIDGAVPRMVTLPSPHPAGGSERYRLVLDSPMRLEYVREESDTVAA